jgi:hypothetical protein
MSRKLGWSGDGNWEPGRKRRGIASLLVDDGWKIDFRLLQPQMHIFISVSLVRHAAFFPSALHLHPLDHGKSQSQPKDSIKRPTQPNSQNNRNL